MTGTVRFVIRYTRYRRLMHLFVLGAVKLCVRVKLGLRLITGIVTHVMRKGWEDETSIYCSINNSRVFVL